MDDLLATKLAVMNSPAANNQYTCLGSPSDGGAYPISKGHNFEFGNWSKTSARSTCQIDSAGLNPQNRRKIESRFLKDM